MKNNFKSIALVGRRKTIGVERALFLLCAYLQKLGVNIVLEQETAQLFTFTAAYPVVTKENLSSFCDLVIVIGGDGSMLSVAPFAAQQNLPVLGINLGKVGFLADVHPDELEKITTILSGNYCEEQRSLLQMQVFAGDKIIAADVVLNDVVLSSGIATKLVEFTLSIDNDCVCDYRSDGLIIATPTGSTAYALSGGGPILHPDLEAVVIVPMFSHNLSSRPIVIKNTSAIDILVATGNQDSLYVSCDGRENVTVPPAARVRLDKAAMQLRLVHPEDYNYFTTLRNKLHWER